MRDEALRMTMGMTTHTKCLHFGGLQGPRMAMTSGGTSLGPLVMSSFESWLLLLAIGSVRGSDTAQESSGEYCVACASPSQSWQGSHRGETATPMATPGIPASVSGPPASQARRHLQKYSAVFPVDGGCDMPTINAAVADLNDVCCPAGTCIDGPPSECPGQCALLMSDVTYGSCAATFSSIMDPDPLVDPGQARNNLAATLNRLWTVCLAVPPETLRATIAATCEGEEGSGDRHRREQEQAESNDGSFPPERRRAQAAARVRTTPGLLHAYVDGTACETLAASEGGGDDDDGTMTSFTADWEFLGGSVTAPNRLSAGSMEFYGAYSAFEFEDGDADGNPDAQTAWPGGRSLMVAWGADDGVSTLLFGGYGRGEISHHSQSW